MSNFRITKLKQVSLEKLMTSFPLAVKELNRAEAKDYFEYVVNEMDLILEQFRLELKHRVLWKEKRKFLKSLFDGLKLFFDKPFIQYIYLWIDGDIRYMKKAVKAYIPKIETHSENQDFINPVDLLVKTLFEKEELLLDSILPSIEFLDEEITKELDEVGINVNHVKIDEMYAKVLQLITKENDAYGKSIAVVFSGVIVSEIYRIFNVMKNIYYELEKDHSQDIDMLFDKIKSIHPPILEKLTLKLGFDTLDVEQKEVSYKVIAGNFKSNEVIDFFSFLYKEKNRTDSTYMDKKDYEKLMKYGLTELNEKPLKQFRLRTDDRKTLSVFYHMIYIFFDKHSDSKLDKDPICKFFQLNFSNFNKTQLSNFKGSVDKNKPKTLFFNIDNYLPDWAKSENLQ